MIPDPKHKPSPRGRLLALTKERPEGTEAFAIWFENLGGAWRDVASISWGTAAELAHGHSRACYAKAAARYRKLGRVEDAERCAALGA